jgi:hypothetical protein
MNKLVCANCRRTFEAVRRNAVTCSPACRKARERKLRAQTVTKLNRARVDDTRVRPDDNQQLKGEPMANSKATAKTTAPATPHPGGATTAKEREELLRFLRHQERRIALVAEEHKAVLIAEFEQQLASIYTYDQHETWSRVAAACEGVVTAGNEKIAEICKELGIPERFAPSVSWAWHGRGENAINERRRELRAVAKTRAEAIAKQFIANGARKMLKLEADIVMSGLTSETAKATLSEIMSVETMPKLDVSRIERLVDNRLAVKSRYGGYLPAGSVDDDC